MLILLGENLVSQLIVIVMLSNKLYIFKKNSSDDVKGALSCS